MTTAPTTASRKIIDLETQFWQSMVDQDTDTALTLLAEPALMVSAHGVMQFDHAGYRKMADQGTMIVTSYEFSDMNVLLPNPGTAVLTYKVKQEVSPRAGGKAIVQDMNDTSTWVQAGERWQCVMHTETPVETKSARH